MTAKRVDDQTKRNIEDILAEGSGDLPAYSLEKDFHVTDAIRAIGALPLPPQFQLVFCGGTCLSKAYGILERFSEDVDFKVVSVAGESPLSRSALRAKLSEFRKSMLAGLTAAGFGAESIQSRSRDEGKYNVLTIKYEAVFEETESLRPHLLLEFNYTQLARPARQLGVGLLFDKLSRGEYGAPFQISCVALEEACSEKLVSFPRRLALHLTRYGEDLTDRWDKALVRHLYDVYQVRAKSAVRPEDMRELLIAAIRKDAAEFANQHPAFVRDPIGQLNMALEQAAKMPEIRRQYEQFVDDMVYGTERPSFAQALSGFSETLRATLPNQRDLSDIAAAVRKPTPGTDDLSM